MQKKISIAIFVLIIISLGFIAGCQQEQAYGCRQVAQGTASSTFSCTYDECQIQGTGDCSTPNPTSYVTYRESTGNYGSGTEIALNTNPSVKNSLVAYKIKSISSDINSNQAYVDSGAYINKINLKTPNGDYIGYFNGKGYARSDVVIGQLTILRFTNPYRISLYFFGQDSTTAISISPNPQIGYEGKEVYSTNLYSCSADLKKGTTLLETSKYEGSISGKLVTSTYYGAKGDIFTYGNNKINYISSDCGPCGECAIGASDCVDSTTITECKSDAQGCGVKQTRQVLENYICVNGEEVKCNDNNVCTNDIRTLSDKSCTYPTIPTCCTQDSECGDNKQCTTDKCVNNRCTNSPVINCCDPSCDSSHTCIGSTCTLKSGCSYNNPPCGENLICDLTKNSCTACNDDNICTKDTRTLSQDNCVFTNIPGCCLTTADCNDNNACTTDSCSSNKCVNSPIASCCNPACDSAHECKNGQCILKTGCNYGNPSCSNPQTCNQATNQCECPTGGDWCSSAEYLSQQCRSNQIWQCDKDTSGLCYAWKKITDCGEQFCI